MRKIRTIKYKKYNLSADTKNSSVPYYNYPDFHAHTIQTPYNTTLPDGETATDHPLIRLLDFFQKILIWSCDKTADFITDLEIQIINKRKKKKMR